MSLIILGTQVILEAFCKSTTTGFMCKDASGPIEQVLYHFLKKSQCTVTDPETKATSLKYFQPLKRESSFSIHKFPNN
jgi:hypothetical protein